jgi:hypothetical protein
MAQATFGSPIKKWYGEQVSLTTTAAHLAFLPNYHEVTLYCSSPWRMGIAPALVAVWYYDATDGSYTPYTQSATDRSTGTHVPLDAMATGDYLYLGFSEPSRGVYIDVSANVNAEAATLDVEYCSTTMTSTAAVAFTDVAGDSDGTDSGGATLAKDGLYTWNLPTAWKRSRIGTWAKPYGPDCYWIRFKPSASLSATVDLLEVIPACDTTNYAYMEGGVIYEFSLNVANTGAFEFDHTSTGTLNVNWIMH